MWNPEQYEKFACERARPFHDLLAQVQAVRVRTVADLGCGPGTLTRILAERWPSASVVGVDRSPEMLAKARPHALAQRLRFEEGDLTTWRPSAPLDLLVSNAALHWVAGHASVLAGWASMLAFGGILAVQMPYSFHTPSHQAIEQVTRNARWADKLGSVGLKPDCVKPLRWYVRRLQKFGLEVNAWKTTYYHVLTGEDPVLEWVKGTALCPLLARLGQEEAEVFLQEVRVRLRAVYPVCNGTTLLPFPRIFFVAWRPERR
jgi:trans-aconitate 2-methyltransferase